MHKKLLQRISLGNTALLLIVLVAPFIFADSAEAAAFQQAYVRPDRLKASTATSGLVCAKTRVGNTETENDVQVTFPSVGGTAFTVSETLGNWLVATDNLPSGATIWPGIGTATAASNTTKTVTFPSTGLAADTLYCFRWTQTTALSTGSAGNDLGGNVKTRTSGPATIESNDYATSIISNDQIVITATVPATFTVAFTDGADPDGDANTDSFTANLSTTTVSTYGMTVTIATNAASGWVAWVKSANAALNSASTGATIATAGSVDNNDTDLAVDVSSGYVLDVDITTDSGTGTGTVTQASGYGLEYAGANTTSGGTLSTTFQPVAASSGTTDGDVLTFTERARISAVQAAATDYTDTLTVIAAGRF